MLYQNLVDYVQNVHTQLLAKDKDRRKVPLIDRISNQNKKVGLLFSGQGFDFMSELRDLYSFSPQAKAWIDFADKNLREWIQSPEILSKGMFPLGLHPVLWIQEERKLPKSYLQRVSVSHPLIFIAQI